MFEKSCWKQYFQQFTAYLQRFLMYLSTQNLQKRSGIQTGFKNDILARRRRRKISVFFGVFDVFPYQGEFPSLFKQNHEFTEPWIHKRMVGCWFGESATQNRYVKAGALTMIYNK